MSLLIICFSCVSAFADTTIVDEQNGIFSLKYYEQRVEKSHYKEDKSFTLSSLPVDNKTLVFFNDSYTDDTCYKTALFIPYSNATIHCKIESKYYTSYYENLGNNEIWFVYFSDLKSVLLFSNVLCYQYTFSDNNNRTLVMSRYYTEQPYYFPSINSKYPYYLCCNDETIINFAVDNVHYKTALIANKNKEGYVHYDDNLFYKMATIIGGYNGSFIDTSFNAVISQKGISCDNSILKNYKYQISYFNNNDLVMMFLNNNKKPDLKIEDYKDGKNTDSKKYTFTYNSSYDTIVYFPQYQKYLNYDDWYNSDSVPKDFRWFWTEDKKSFSLISDWNVSFDDTGKASYTGTRVVVNWKLDESSIDNISLTKSWQVDKEMLKDKGWQDGRPSDQNYPYCVQLWQNNIPIYSVYFNSKPKVRINRESDYYCEYAIDMIGMCGYVYSEWADMSTQFDFTTGKVAKGSDILSQGQNLVWYLFNDLGGRADDSCLLHLYDNYKGDGEHFVGTKVFFNWDVTSNTFDTNLNNQHEFDYSKTLLKGGEYKDENGHIHGGSLKNYDDEDLNKWNTNGKDDNSNKDTSSSSDFDFSFEGISEYCNDFWNFMQSALAIFPSFVWLLVFVSISVLIALRLLGR